MFLKIKIIVVVEPMKMFVGQLNIWTTGHNTVFRSDDSDIKLGHLKYCVVKWENPSDLL